MHSGDILRAFVGQVSASADIVERPVPVFEGRQQVFLRGDDVSVAYLLKTENFPVAIMQRVESALEAIHAAWLLGQDFVLIVTGERTVLSSGGNLSWDRLTFETRGRLGTSGDANFLDSFVEWLNREGGFFRVSVKGKEVTLKFKGGSRWL